MPPVVRSIDDVTRAEVDRCSGTKIQVLIGRDDGAERFYTRLFTIDPGGSIPAHRHADIEHEQVVLEGTMRIALDGDERDVNPGDCLLIPAGTAHWYANRGTTPVRFLCVVPATATYDSEWL